MLALNATIEAASAGEAGRGFAVVADHIKDLALQCKSAAESIDSSISGIQNSMNLVEDDISQIDLVIAQLRQATEEIQAKPKTKTPPLVK